MEVCHIEHPQRQTMSDKRKRGNELSCELMFTVTQDQHFPIYSNGIKKCTIGSNYSLKYLAQYLHISTKESLEK